jgi:excisionase family DNA binding protein
VSKITDLATHADRYVSTSELAAYWGVAERTIRTWFEKGALHGERIGRQIRIYTTSARTFGRPTDYANGSGKACAAPTAACRLERHQR